MPLNDVIINQMLVGAIPIVCPELTDNNRVQRDTVDELVNYIKLYAMFHGFAVSQDSERAGKCGRLYCSHCASTAQSKAAAAQANSDARLGMLDASIDGRMEAVAKPVRPIAGPSRCWEVRYNVQKDGKVNLTKRILEHSHTMKDPVLGEQRVAERASQVTDVEQTMLEKLLKVDKINRFSSLKGIMQDIYGVEYNENVFKSMLRKARFNTKIPDGQEFVRLLAMLYERHLINGDYYNYSIDEEGVIDRVFFMSHDMIWNFQRNGQALTMDTTMKTNRFGLPLCLICGVNEYDHTMIVAVALTSRQNTDAFDWILSNMKRAVGKKSWEQVKSIITDGDRAMKKAIDECLPNARPLRCIFHLRMNIQSNLAKKLDEKLDPFVAEWNNIAARSYSIAEFNEAKQKLMSEFPEATDYMQINIWSIEQQFAFCHIKDVTTFGMRSTQRVEGKNAQLKGPLGIDSQTELVKTAEKLFACVNEEDQRKINEDRVNARQPNSHSMASWWWELTTICTPAAVAWIKKEAELEENYVVEGPNVMRQFVVKPASHVRQRYHTFLNSLSTQKRTKLMTAVVARDIASIDAATNVESLDSSSNNSDDAEERQLQQAAVLHLLLNEPAQVVTDIASQSVNCTCGAVSRMLLPCRHVIAVNRKLSNQRFRPAQIINRWRRDYMIDPATKKPEKVKMHLWQPDEMKGEMRILSTAPMQHVDLETKVDSLLDRLRSIATKSTALFHQLVTLVKPWIESAIEANPEWTGLVRDPPIKYGARTSKKRVRSNGEDGESAKNTRTATQQEITEFLSQRDEANSQVTTMNPTPAFDESTEAKLDRELK